MKDFKMCRYCFVDAVVLGSLCGVCTTNQVSLDVFPGTSVFEGHFFILKCVSQEQSGDWAVHRNTSKHPYSQQCGHGWGKRLSSSCKVGLAVTWDSGFYWCQSTGGAVSSTTTVRVTSGNLMVVVPLVPVNAGEDVTLSCLNRSRSSVPAHFYRDDLQLTSDHRRDLSLGPVSFSDQGWYKCISADTQSLPALLQIHNHSDEFFPTNSTSEPDSAHLHTVVRLLCHLLVFCPYCISTVLMVSLYRHLPKEEKRPRFKVKHEEYDDVVAALFASHTPAFPPPVLLTHTYLSPTCSAHTHLPFPTCSALTHLPFPTCSAHTHLSLPHLCNLNTHCT
ncbi:hypothetical protein WMY93_014745 [Mugilogobius chulae]|uniref:Immunoglobulin domain-containing protein n=1 Tax=Mugilogobius chulae TaxID=88201 RepID=A0AAW0P585_9GOBI